MQQVNTVWAIIFIEAEDGSAEIDDWNVGSALFSNMADATDYAMNLAQFDSMNVYDVLALHVYEGTIEPSGPMSDAMVE